ncbi:hypothetical protein V2W45_1432772, partial [Cenococcum geophilum]
AQAPHKFLFLFQFFLFSSLCWAVTLSDRINSINNDKGPITTRISVNRTRISVDYLSIDRTTTDRTSLDACTVLLPK